MNSLFYATLLFFLGASWGSFLGVIIDRYRPEHFLFSRPIIGGRSQCSFCRKKLRWFELIPLVSFLLQRGRCRHCQAPLSLWYLGVELLTGMLLVIVYLKVFSWYETFQIFFFILWALIFLTLFLLAALDIRWRIIPDEIQLILFVLAIPLSFLSYPSFGLIAGSFLGPLALPFGFREFFFLNRLMAVVFALLFFGTLIVVTRGRGMGGGDFKLAGVLGLIFGWPDTVVIVGLSFILGTLVALPALFLGRKKMKDFVPFGPFLVMASFFIFLWGEKILASYFSLFSG